MIGTLLLGRRGRALEEIQHKPFRQLHDRQPLLTYLKVPRNLRLARLEHRYL